MSGSTPDEKKTERARILIYIGSTATKRWTRRKGLKRRTAGEKRRDWGENTGILSPPGLAKGS